MEETHDGGSWLLLLGLRSEWPSYCRTDCASDEVASSHVAPNTTSRQTLYTFGKA